ncbi:MAG: hypothetical protein FJX19_04175 [Alphaproteobacteria bacterium]|nr:hypothetical protein [Alphaproteobacteria bacterium]
MAEQLHGEVGEFANDEDPALNKRRGRNSRHAMAALDLFNNHDRTLAKSRRPGNRGGPSDGLT